MEKKIKQFCYISKKKFWVWKKNQTILLHFEKKILGIEKKIKQFCYFSKKKILGMEKIFFLKCATQIKYRSNVFVTFQKKKTVIRYTCITLNARSHSLTITITITLIVSNCN